VDVEQILDIVHQTAAEMVAAKNGVPVGYSPAVRTEGADSLVDRYGFSSIDALECLLILEGKFGITLADEDLSEDVLSSATALARHIAGLRKARHPFGPVIGYSR
jgi:acyl carrier protein